MADEMRIMYFSSSVCSSDLAHTSLILCREFTRRHQHQRTTLLARRLVAAGMQALQHWQRERGVLAGTGLRGGEQIVALEDFRDRLSLDRRWFGVTLVGNSTRELGREAEAREN